MFEKILAPIDGSKQAYDALVTALELAKIHKSEVTILHVTIFSEEIPEKKVGIKEKYNSPSDWVKNYMSKIKENDENMLNEVMKNAKKNFPEVKISTKILLGLPGDIIVNEAENGKYDLIVMGSRGLGGLRELVLGSVSQHVVNQSKISVLVVK
jgi:nucleotide-binding universal stress UspA family protein